MLCVARLTCSVVSCSLINNPTYQACPGQPPLKEGHDNKFRCERNVTSIVCVPLLRTFPCVAAPSPLHALR